MKTDCTPLRVGVIDYINSYPLFYPMRAKKVPSSCQFIVGGPFEINDMLKKKEIDIGLISSSSYLEQRSSCILLSDYGIGAREKISSICLFCKQQNFDFTKASSFLIPSHSATSARLLKIIAQWFWKSDASFAETYLSDDALFKQDLPFLLIGDSCLQRQHETGSICDLATEWYKASKKSFVFALIATRNEIFISKQKEVLQFHRNLMDAYGWYKQNHHEIVSISAEKVHLPTKQIEEYFHALDYELQQDHIHGLDHFSTFKI